MILPSRESQTPEASRGLPNGVSLVESRLHLTVGYPEKKNALLRRDVHDQQRKSGEEPTSLSFPGRRREHAGGPQRRRVTPRRRRGGHECRAGSRSDARFGLVCSSSQRSSQRRHADVCRGRESPARAAAATRWASSALGEALRVPSPPASHGRNCGGPLALRNRPAEFTSGASQAQQAQCPKVIRTARGQPERIASLARR